MTWNLLEKSSIIASSALRNNIMTKSKSQDNKSQDIKKVAVGLSGGVDSSVAALLLKEQGYDVTGVYLKCYEQDGEGCESDKDRVSAVTVCSDLGIKFEYQNYVKEYNKNVIDHFFDEYKKGRTPNPDIICNTDIKFGLFLDWAMKNGFDHIATGHYTRVKANGGVKLLKGVDDSKDQSYFLYRLTQDQLSKVIFPLGEITKKDVRALAKKADLSTHGRPDSQGICFIGKVDIKEFLMQRIKPKKGKVFHVDGSEIGEHEGVWFYTIGQRHGFKVKKYYGLPLYVVDKNVEDNKLIVGFAKDALKKEFIIDNLHWISGKEPQELSKKEGLPCQIRIRHLGNIHDSNLTKHDDNKLNVKMDDPSFGVAPGQSAVIYVGDEVLGGGIIC